MLAFQNSASSPPRYLKHIYIYICIRTNPMTGLIDRQENLPRVGGNEGIWARLAWCGSRAAEERPEAIEEASRAAQLRPGAAQDRPCASKERPLALQERPRAAQERPRAAQDRSKVRLGAILARLGAFLGKIY